MTRAQQVAERYLDKTGFDPGYSQGFIDGAEWQKTAALKSVERRKTGRPKRAVQQRKQYICPFCRQPAVVVDNRVKYHYINLRLHSNHYTFARHLCEGTGKRPAVA
jgi:hypothetical protein